MVRSQLRHHFGRAHFPAPQHPHTSRDPQKPKNKRTPFSVLGVGYRMLINPIFLIKLAFMLGTPLIRVVREDYFETVTTRHILSQSSGRDYGNLATSFGPFHFILFFSHFFSSATTLPAPCGVLYLASTCACLLAAGRCMPSESYADQIRAFPPFSLLFSFFRRWQGRTRHRLYLRQQHLHQPSLVHHRPTRQWDLSGAVGNRQLCRAAWPAVALRVRRVRARFLRRRGTAIIHFWSPFSFSHVVFSQAPSDMF